MPQQTDVQNILSALKDLDSQTSFKVFVPSLNKELNFKQISIKQLKQLLKCVIDSPVYTTEYILTINNIIKENSITLDIDISKLTILDKLLIIIKLRAESISPNFILKFTQEEIEQNNLTFKEYPINLNDIYDRFINEHLEVQSQTFIHGDVEVICNLPTIDTEDRLEQELHKNTKLQITSPDELRTSLGNLFINEVTKFIQELKIKQTSIDFSILDFKTRIQIVEELPVNVLSDVLKYIENYKQITNMLTVHAIDIDNTVTLKEIPQDPTFFSI